MNIQIDEKLVVLELFRIYIETKRIFWSKVEIMTTMDLKVQIIFGTNLIYLSIQLLLHSKVCTFIILLQVGSTDSCLHIHKIQTAVNAITNLVKYKIRK